MPESYELDAVTLLTPIAVGQPGKRTFFVAIGESGRWLRLWLEKQDLQGLAMAVRQLLFALSQQERPLSGGTEAAPVCREAPAGLPSAELEIEELTLGYADDAATIDVKAHRSGPRSADQATVHCRATLGQLRDLGNEAERVCAAGRPRCPLCGEPMDPTGHDCPASN